MTISSIGSSSALYGQLASQRLRAESGSTGQTEKTGKPPSMEKMFSALDADSSGSLSGSELQDLSEKISSATGVSVDLSEFMSNYDKDGDGSLSQDETVSALEANKPQGPPPGSMGGMQGGGGVSGESEMVSSADGDGDGTISADEASSLVDVINKATGSSLKAEDFVSQYDSNGDGSLSTDEAVSGMSANKPQGGPPPPPPGGMGGAQGPDESDMVSSADSNGDGVISADEATGLVDIINNATGSSMEAEDFLSQYDSNGDGSLSTDEAVTGMNANRPQGSKTSGDQGDSGSSTMDAAFTAAIEEYLKVATMGIGGQAGNSLTQLLGSSEGTSINNQA